MLKALGSLLILAMIVVFCVQVIQDLTDGCDTTYWPGGGGGGCGQAPAPHEIVRQQPDIPPEYQCVRGDGCGRSVLP